MSQFVVIRRDADGNVRAQLKTADRKSAEIVAKKSAAAHPGSTVEITEERRP